MIFYILMGIPNLLLTMVLAVLLVGPLAAGAQNDIVIESFGSPGQITFDKVANATQYRVEWFSAAGTAWTNFGLPQWDAIVSPGLGVVTVSVPMLYRVAAIMTNPPGTPIHRALIPMGSSVTNAFPAVMGPRPDAGARRHHGDSGGSTTMR